MTTDQPSSGTSADTWARSVIESIDAARAYMVEAPSMLTEDGENGDTVFADPMIPDLVRARRALKTALDRLDAMIDSYA